MRVRGLRSRQSFTFCPAIVPQYAELPSFLGKSDLADISIQLLRSAACDWCHAQPVLPKCCVATSGVLDAKPFSETYSKEHQSMRLLQLAIATSVLALLLAAELPAQTPPSPTSQSDTAVATDSSDSGESGDESTCRWCMHGKLADPWTIPQPNCLKESNMTVGGWLEGGIYANQWGAANNGPVGMRSIGNGLTVDQVWIYAERKTDTKDRDWDIGGRVDYVFGVDGPQTQSFGDHIVGLRLEHFAAIRLGHSANLRGNRL